jgi:hypothetical protein
MTTNDDKARKAAEEYSTLVRETDDAEAKKHGAIACHLYSTGQLRKAFLAGYQWAMLGKGEPIKAIYHDDALPPAPEVGK